MRFLGLGIFWPEAMKAVNLDATVFDKSNFHPVLIKIDEDCVVSGTVLQSGGLYQGFELTETHGPNWARRSSTRYLIDTREDQMAEFGASLGTGPEVTAMFLAGKAVVTILPRKTHLPRGPEITRTKAHMNNSAE
jgi:hypothetical protein